MQRLQAAAGRGREKPAYTRRHVLAAAVKFRLRYQRGLAWFGDLKYLVGVAMALQIFGLPLWLLGPATAVAIVAAYVIGHFDEKRGIWRMEYAYGSGRLNPFLQGLDRKLDLLLARRRNRRRLLPLQ